MAATTRNAINNIQTDRWSGHRCCTPFGPCRIVWEVRCMQVWHWDHQQGSELASLGDGEALVYEDITKVSLIRIWYQFRFRKNPACPRIRGQDVEIVKQDLSGAGVEWIICCTVSQTNRLIVGQTYKLTDSTCKSVWQSTWLTHIDVSNDEGTG